MYLLASFLFVSYFALALGLPLEPDVSRTGDRKLPSPLQQDTMPQLGVLPNPYPVPGKPFDIVFIAAEEEISRVNVIGCLSQAYKQVMEQIEQGRAGEPITRPAFRSYYLNIVFMIDTAFERILTYSDAKEILKAFWLKSAEEGYRVRKSFIKDDHSGNVLGIAGLRLKPQLQTLSARAFPRMEANRTSLIFLPNPYPVPGKPYSLLFMVGEELNRVDVRGCLSQAYKQVVGYIEQGRGEETISRLGIHQTYRSVAFSLASIAARFIPLTYNNAKEVLNAFWLKSSGDGDRTRSACIIHDQGREIGIATLYRKQRSQILSTRESLSSQANRTSLKFLPNPYDVPGKPFVMDWVIQSDALPRENVRGCLSQAYGEIQDHIERFGGDDPLPTDPRYLSNIFVNVRFGISGDLNSPSQITLTYGDALPILEALWLKGSLEEYRGWVVNIISTKNDEHIGDAVLWDYPRAQSLSRNEVLRL